MLAPADTPAWENLTALAAVLGAFLFMLRWVLGTLTAKLDQIAQSVVDLAKSTLTMHDAIRRDAEAHANLMRELVAQVRQSPSRT